MEQRDVTYVAPPVAWFAWHAAGDVRELRTDEPIAADVHVLDSAGVACPKTETGFQWGEAQPRQVRLRWRENAQQHESLTPIVDQYGRIAATELPCIDTDEAWWQLADFPLPPDEDSGDEGDDGRDESDGKDIAKSRSVATTSYPIRQMMDLIESIAAKQTGIDEMDWVLWCNRLEQTLGQAADSAPVKYFRDKLGLNPLSPLRLPSFRPSFAENRDQALGAIYDDALGRTEVSWKVNELSPIGARNET